jgi:hypothetical protein
MMRRGLTKGCLINAGGQVCWMDELQHFRCGLSIAGRRAIVTGAKIFKKLIFVMSPSWLDAKI